jgi:hypothetical protein
MHQNLIHGHHRFLFHHQKHHQFQQQKFSNTQVYAKIISEELDKAVDNYI